MSQHTAWQPVMGLEIHIQLATQSKIFSAAPVHFGAAPNTRVDWIDAGFPGTLPVLNETAVRYAVYLGQALHAEIARRSLFERKHYIYPDLPKGYQITQSAEPILVGGALSITLASGQSRVVQIHHAHLEEDAGRLLHDVVPHGSAVDLNRAGVPLIEIVSCPDLYSVEEAVTYAKTMHALVRWLGICDGNLQEGSFRVDANISVRPRDADVLGTRIEIKNLNSFRFLEKALQYEINRHIALYESGRGLQQAETRLYDADKNETRFMRYKEREQDYRYFPDPDLPPLLLSDEQIEAWLVDMPTLPEVYKEQYLALALTAQHCAYILQSRAHQAYFDALCQLSVPPVVAANWMAGELASHCHEHVLSIDHLPFSPTQLAYVLHRLAEGRITAKGAKVLLADLCASPHDVSSAGEALIDQWIDDKNLSTLFDPAVLADMIAAVLQDHPKVVAEYRAGKEKAFHALLGAVMKKTGGRADPASVRTFLLAALSGNEHAGS